MAKKSDNLSTRQRQSQQIMRDKGAKKKRKALLRKATIAAGALCAFTVVAGGVWVWKTSAISRAANAVTDGAYNMTAKAGFSLQNVYLEGRGRTSMEEINNALGIKKGEPILRLSLDETREKLEQIESVKMAAVERSLPDTLIVRVVEREPVAVWQYQGQLALVDDKGTVMRDIDSKPYQELPLIVGSDAPSHVAELMEILAAEPELAKRFSSAIYVGERRWNIRLASGVEIKLPQDDAVEEARRAANQPEIIGSPSASD
jgi:cell division protein FtsQ